MNPSQYRRFHPDHGRVYFTIHPSHTDPDRSRLWSTRCADACVVPDLGARQSSPGHGVLRPRPALPLREAAARLTGEERLVLWNVVWDVYDASTADSGSRGIRLIEGP